VARRHPHCGFVGWAIAAVDIGLLRSTAGGRALSGEMLLILSFVVFDNYELFPGKKVSHAGSNVD
jgi:hypothetical protein